ncbi:MAG: hypothetical protein CUN57_01995, partial [Phototrophicales bacterium]
MPPRGWDQFKNPNSQSVWNNADGINPDSSHDVLIEDCLFHTGDDCVPVKNTGAYQNTVRDVYHVQVRRCACISSVTALKIGTETRTSRMRDITFEDIDLIETSRAFGLDVKDGAIVENVTFKNIRVHVCNRPFDFWIIPREKHENQV